MKCMRTIAHEDSKSQQPGCGHAWRKSAMVPLMILLGLLPAERLRATVLNEYQVKAAFLFNFAKFVDWPDGTYATPRAPFAICILGKDPFGSTLDELLSGKSMENHPVSILRLRDRTEGRHCQMVFVSSSETRNYAEIIEALRGASVLIVGETDGFAASGGAIEFILEEDHVRFAINPEAARRAGLKCSSRLLALAKIVHDAPGPGRS